MDPDKKELIAQLEAKNAEIFEVAGHVFTRINCIVVLEGQLATAEQRIKDLEERLKHSIDREVVLTDALSRSWPTPPSPPTYLDDPQGG